MPTYRGETLRLGSLVGIKGSIENTTFEECTLVGPAIVMAQGSFDFIDSNIDAGGNDPDAMFWECQSPRIMLGAIVLENCQEWRVGVLLLAALIVGGNVAGDAACGVGGGG